MARSTSKQRPMSGASVTWCSSATRSARSTQRLHKASSDPRRWRAPPGAVLRAPQDHAASHGLQPVLRLGRLPNAALQRLRLLRLGAGRLDELHVVDPERADGAAVLEVHEVLDEVEPEVGRILRGHSGRLHCESARIEEGASEPRVGMAAAAGGAAYALGTQAQASAGAQISRLTSRRRPKFLRVRCHASLQALLIG